MLARMSGIKQISELACLPMSGISAGIHKTS